MRPVMLGGLALAVALSAWFAFQDDGGAVDAPRPEKGTRSKVGRMASPKTAGVSKDNPEDAQSLVRFVAHWQDRVALAPIRAGDGRSPWASQSPPPPPAPVVVEAPASPMAPVFPHAWAGRFNDRAIVAGPNTTWVVGQGDVIDGQWRVDQIQDRQMRLTYLPLNQSQSVAMKAP